MKIITEGKVEREVEITKVQEKEIPIIIYCQICDAKILDKIGFH
ncbi:hypothetical protein ES705_40595 [subsurface metagenome]